MNGFTACGRVTDSSTKFYRRDAMGAKIRFGKLRTLRGFAICLWEG